jgi:protein-disulfide isomerase
VGRRSKLILVLGGAALAAAPLIAASVIGTRGSDTKTVASGTTLPGAGEVAAELRGIPQHNLVLGRANAPVTLVEYADLQCPFCAAWTVNVLPELVRDYVRTGKLRLEWRGIAFIGPDSSKALRAVDAAGLQNRLWHTVEIVYRNQGSENSGWVSDDYVAAAARSARADVDKLLADMDSDAVSAAMTRAEEQARAAGVDRTPTFEIGRTGGKLERLQFTKLEPAEFKAAVEEQLRR